MDFFEQQDRARRQTRRLVALFALGVAAVVVFTTAVVAAALALADPATDAALGATDTTITRPFSLSDLADDWRVLAVVAGATTLLILLGSLWRLLQLGSDGAGVAESLGGRLLDHDTTDDGERRLLNIVEEMAIASGMPVPPVYLMRNERAINAFAAGTTPENAVIGVTRGAVNHLSRSELQGVVGHEFSHILSGDMRINLRLIGILAGILVIGHLGHLLMRSAYYAGSARSSSRERGAGNAGLILLAIGGALALIGFVGVFFGSWIKGAISRQREYLADASAVQFTRSRDGLAGALKKIGGFRRRGTVMAAGADECSHMFFVKGLGSIFATHPPLSDRILALDPTWDGSFTRVEDMAVPPPAASAKKPEPPRIDPTHFAHAVVLSAAALIGQPTSDHLAYAASLYSAIPEPLRRMAGEPFGARAVVAALLISRDKAPQRKQIQIVRDLGGEALLNEIKAAAPLVAKLDAALRLPLLELTAPSLRRLSDPQAATMSALLDELVRADGSIDLYEWCVSRMARRALSVRHEAKLGTLYYSPKAVAVEAERLLGWIAHAGHTALSDAGQAYAAGAMAFELTPNLAPRGDFHADQLDEALDVLVRSSPKVKKKLVQACAIVISADRTVTPQEAELFRIVSETLGVPTPPVLPGQRLI